MELYNNEMGGSTKAADDAEDLELAMEEETRLGKLFSEWYEKRWISYKEFLRLTGYAF